MDIKIDIAMGSGTGSKQINCASWDPEFMTKIFMWLNRQHEAGNEVAAGAGFHLLTKGHKALIDAIEEIMGEKQDELNITIHYKRRKAKS
jgi:hypothetical protein